MKESASIGVFAWATERASRWNLGAKTVRRLFNRQARDGIVSRFAGAFEGWFKSRDLPAMPEKTVHERMEEQAEEKTSKE